MDIAQNLLSFLKPELVKEIMDASTIQDIPKGTEILREDQYVKVLPIVVEGLVKVHSRFNEKELLLDTISHLLLDKMDKRIYDHLKKKSELSNSTSLKLSHGQIANELGTAREVVSRIIKKLENDRLIEQNSGYIKITTIL